MPKIKGPGGLGQWDTGTANRDIRASVPRSSNTGSRGSAFVGSPAEIAAHLGVGRNKKRPSKRKNPRAKRR